MVLDFYKFFLSDRINRIARIISQLPEEAVKVQFTSGEGFSFSLFFRESENDYPVRLGGVSLRCQEACSLALISLKIHLI
jgi:hypothetical protein